MAHSLKTPLSVIRAELDKTDIARDSTAVVHEQTQRINDIITHQLQRASMRAMTVGAQRTSLHHIIERLSKALTKVYLQKNVHFHNRVATTVFIHIDEGDLLEIFGNIIENAFKYCRSSIDVSAHEEDHNWRIHIDDDGQGIPGDKQRELLRRGARLDTATSGQGIGLSICLDIISGYNGGLSMAQSELGGARIIVELPKTHSSTTNTKREKK